jgi:hypothetical protein
VFPLMMQLIIYKKGCVCTYVKHSCPGSGYSNEQGLPHPAYPPYRLRERMHQTVQLLRLTCISEHCGGGQDGKSSAVCLMSVQPSIHFGQCFLVCRLFR